ncbi:MAG TPA: helix-turn-helix transcriptional regulator [Acidimicrobiales bacterium]|nr:helix-turn-helix transcriptional regulator [Acidimicrobiales bacterium]
MGLDVQALGARVKSLREERGLSAAAVARRWTEIGGEGRSSSYVYQLEAGKLGTRLGQRDVIALAEAMRADPAEFLTAAGMTIPEHLEDAPQRFVRTVYADPFLRDEQKRYLIEAYRLTRGLRPEAVSTLLPRDAAP